MKWFRMYSEVLHDSKVQTLPPDLFRAWVNILCVASEATDRGVLPDVQQIAFLLRVKTEKAQQVLNQLVETGLLDRAKDGTLSPHNWDARQPENDTSTTRVQRYRERIRSNGETVAGYTKFRDEVFSRDEHACVYCGSTKKLVLDHLVPVNRGGLGIPENLVAACKACNSGKSGRLVEESGYVFKRAETEHQYAEAKSRFLTDDVTVTATDVTVTETSLAGAAARGRSEIRGEEIREEQPPLPPNGGDAAAAVPAPLPSGAEDAIEAARDRFGDPAAALVRAKAATIDAQLGGRFDLFLEAMDAASHHEPPLKHVFPWCMARAKARINQPPREENGARTKFGPADRGAPIPSEAESRDCPHCSGMGQVTVFHPTPDHARRIPGATAADCVCPRGRLIRGKRDDATARRIPDLADILDRRSVWLLDPPGANGTH